MKEEEIIIANMLNLIEEMGIVLDSKYWNEEFRNKFNKITNSAEIYLNKP